MPTQNKNKESSLLDQLTSLANILGPVLNATGNMAASGAQAMQSSPLGVPGQLMNAANAGQMAAQQLNPYQKGVEKALKEGGYNHATEAIQAGVPAENIVKESGINEIQNQQQAAKLQMNPPSGPLAMGGAKVDPKGNVAINEAAPIMKFLLNWIGMGQNSFANQDIKTIGGAQKVAGMEPMQAGVKEQQLLQMISSLPENMIERQKAAATSIKPLMESRNVLQKATGQLTPEVTQARQATAQGPASTSQALQLKIQKILEMRNQMSQVNAPVQGSFGNVTWKLKGKTKGK